MAENLTWALDFELVLDRVILQNEVPGYLVKMVSHMHCATKTYFRYLLWQLDHQLTQRCTCGLLHLIEFNRN